ncbi:MAG: hypothetical protein KJ905_03710 [Nanoarchaeota archaeon]|nr:hypothetical protein [Nanoarchaeota archaeon]MBU1501847.1 hypothetical protein [Nanoarchaeota archaeon]MBU2459221.1 hypothetical protein [Nanoarchaeota archaeon]
MNPNHYPGNPQSYSRTYNPSNLSENSGMKLSWILGIIAIVVVAGLASLFIFFSGENEKQAQTDLNPESREGSTALAIDCRDDMNCLIKESSNCNPAKGTVGSTFDFFGDLITTITFYEVKGTEENKCILYTRYESQTHDYSEEVKAQLLEAGTTEQEIEQMIEESNAASEAIKGTGSICRFGKNSDLISYFELVEAGDFSFSLSGSLTSEGFQGETKVGDIVMDCESFSP